MGRPTKVRGPIAFMPSDGKFLGSRDLRGLPLGPEGERIKIRVVEVVQYPAGEVICGRKNTKAFWAMIFDRPSKDGWQRSRKEWKLGPTCVQRLAFRLGDDASLWPGAIVPLCFEATSFGMDDVWGVRPVPLPWENDPQRRRQAMAEIAAGTYQPPGLGRPVDADRERAEANREAMHAEEQRRAARSREATYPQPAEDFDQRQPGEDDEPLPASDEPDDIEPPDDAPLSVPMQGQEP